MKTDELAKKLNLELIGDSNTEITEITSLEQVKAGSLSFATKRSLIGIALDQIDFACLIIPSNLKLELPKNKNFILSDKPHHSLVAAIELFYPQQNKSFGISKKASIAENVKLGKNVSIADFVVIKEGVEIADNCIIHSNTIIYPNVKIASNTEIHANCVIREATIIGANCIIHACSVIGAEGFGYIPDAKLGLKAVPQIGIVVLEDYVHVGASTTIDRAALGETRIGYGTKIDNQVQIGHNCKIGKFCLICGQVGIAGSVEIGDQVVLGGAVGVADHLKIAPGVRVAGGSVVLTSLKEKADYFGLPAIEASRGKRNAMAFANLAQTIKDLKNSKS